MNIQQFQMVCKAIAEYNDWYVDFNGSESYFSFTTYLNTMENIGIAFLYENGKLDLKIVE